MAKSINRRINIWLNGKQVGNTLKDLRGATRKLSNELAGLEPGTEDFIKKSKDLKKVKARMKEVRTEIHGTGRSISRLKEGVGALGIAFSAAFAARAIIRQIGKAIEVIKNYDESIANLRKTTNLSRIEAGKLAIEIIKLDTTTSVTSLLELATAAGRLGLEGKDIIDFTKQADRAFVALGDSLEGSAEEIGLTLGKLAANFDLEKKYGIGEALNKIGSALNELGASSKAQEGPIIDFTKRLSGVASQAKISITDIMALGALFDETGQSIEVAATTFNKLLPAIGKDVERFAKIAGMNITEFRRIVEKDAFEALKLVAKGAQSNQEGLLGLTETLESYGISNARAASIVGILSSKIERLTELQKINSEGFEEGTSMLDEFNIKMNTLEASFDKLGKAQDVYVITKLRGSTGIIKGTIDLITEFINLQTQQEVNAQIFREVADAAHGSGERIIKLKQIIRDTTRSEGEHAAAIKQLRTQLQWQTGDFENAERQLKNFTDAIIPNIEGTISTSDAIKKWRENLEKMTGKTEEAIIAEKERAKTIGELKEELRDLRKAQDELLPGSKELLENKKRMAEINGILKEQTKEQKSAYELEKQLLSDLKKQLDEQAFAGKVNNETLERYKEVLEGITEAEEEVIEALRSTGTEARIALEVIVEHAQVRIDSLRKIQGASEETEAEILKTKLDSAKMQMKTLMKMEMKAGEARDFQIEKEKELAAEIVELENQIQAKKLETADRSKEYKQASIDEQKEMLQQWYDDQIISRDEFDERMAGRDELLKEKKAEEREVKKQEDIEYKKELEEALSEVALNAAQQTADAIFSVTEANRKREFDAKLKTAQETADGESKILNERLKRDKKRLKDKYKKEKKALKDKLDNDTITRKQYNDILFTLDNRYESASLSLKDSFETKKAIIDDEAAKKQDELRREAFKKQKKADIKQALINGVLAVMKAIAMYGPPPSPMGIAGMIAAGLTTGIQVAVIKSHKYVEGGETPDKASLAWVGEKGVEWFAPNWMYESPMYADTFAMLEYARQNRIGRYQEGGPTAPQNIPAAAEPDIESPDIQLSNETQLQILNAIEKLNDRLDNPTPVRAFFTPDEVEDINDFNDELQKIKDDANIG